MRGYAVQAGFGVAFGFVLSRGGFADWHLVHGMLRLRVWDLAIAFATVLLLTGPLWRWLERYAAIPLRRPIHPGSISGGLVFGVGWALTGACPALALVQLGQGKALAAISLLGMVLGNYAYAITHERCFRWHTASCADD